MAETRRPVPRVPIFAPMANPNDDHGTEPAVSLRRVVRRYGSVTALDRLDLEVPRGAFFALVGRNGAGKTTTFRIIAGFSGAEEGAVSILGHRLESRAGRTAVRARIGIVPDFCPLFEPLTVHENALCLGRFRGLAPPVPGRRLEELATALGAEGMLDRVVASLSRGQRKQAALIVAMLHAPEMLLLDEPFAGLDPISARSIRALLEELRRRGVTIFMTSHTLPLVERVATHVAILEAGRLLETGTLHEMLGDASCLEEHVVSALGAGRPLPDLSWYVP